MNDRWWQLTYFFGIFIPKFGEMIQFDEHIFPMGWFNHQLVSNDSFIQQLSAMEFYHTKLPLNMFLVFKLHNPLFRGKKSFLFFWGGGVPEII